jgi:hypothetical protein
MAFSNRSHAEEMTHQLSVKIFDEHLSDQTPNPPHIPQQYYPSQLHVDLNYNPQISVGLSQVSSITSIQQLALDSHCYIQRVQNIPHQHLTQASWNHRSNLKMTREERELPQLMMHLGDAIMNKLLCPDGVLISARCKVSNCKTSYNYVIKNSLSQFKKYVDKHIAKNEEPQERPNTHMVQSCLNSDDTRHLSNMMKKKC